MFVKTSITKTFQEFSSIYKFKSFEIAAAPNQTCKVKVVIVEIYQSIAQSSTYSI